MNRRLGDFPSRLHEVVTALASGGAPKLHLVAPAHAPVCAHASGGCTPRSPVQGCRHGEAATIGSVVPVVVAAELKKFKDAGLDGTTIIGFRTDNGAEKTSPPMQMPDVLNRLS